MVKNKTVNPTAVTAGVGDCLLICVGYAVVLKII
jgi:hypothetical protein